ncbi:MAG: helix-turn-helix domain-containing protein [Myxococcota bacterium]
MKEITDFDHYELLEISQTADADDVDRAYRAAQQIYGEGSLALYSVVDDKEAAVIREQLDEAYRVLSDSELRARYDVSRGYEPVSGSKSSTPDSSSALESDFESTSDLPGAAATGEAAGFDVDEGTREYDVFGDEAGGDFNGLRLKRTRLFRGFEINDIVDVTKISGGHLRNIEDENFIDLPADVYVRGFVSAYATTIGLDPKVVVPSYMALVEAARTANQRSGFLGRK